MRRKEPFLGVLLAVLGIAGCASSSVAPSPERMEPIADFDPALAARAIVDTSDLELGSVRQSRTGQHVRFIQRATDGSRVVDAEVAVHFRADGAPALVRDVEAHGIEVVGSRPSETVATRRALEAVGGGTIEAIEAVALPTRDASVRRAGWRVLVRQDDPAHLYETWIDGRTATVELRRERLAFANGTGLVFTPNPIASTGDTTLMDNTDATSAALDAARVLVTLPRLDGSGFLRGTYADVRPAVVASRAQSATLAFAYDRADDRFEEVSAYYHIDRAQQFLQDAGYTNVNNRRQVAIVNASAADNSYYDPASRELRFGTGGVDDAEDGDVVLHEYGHAILDDMVPGFGAGGDAAAIGEGFATWFAAAIPTNGPDLVARTCIGAWNASSFDTASPPCSERLDVVGHIPEHLVGSPLDDGQLYASSLREAFGDAGFTPAESLTPLVESAFMLSTGPTFGEAGDALIAADLSIFAGAHRAALETSLTWRGVLATPHAPDPFVGAPQTRAFALAVDAPADHLDRLDTITEPGATAIRVHFSRFDLESGAGCRAGLCDRVYLYDGARRLYAVLGGALGAMDAPAIPGDTVLVRTITDLSNASVGFTIDRYDYLGASDAAVELDAGLDAASDLDSGSTTLDGGLDAALGPDAAAGVDAARGPDAAVGVDASDLGRDAAGASDAGTPSGPSGAACGCRVAAPRSSGWVPTLVAVLSVGIRLGRRRSRSR